MKRYELYDALSTVTAGLNLVTAIVAACLGEWNQATFFMSAAVFCVVIDLH